MKGDSKVKCYFVTGTGRCGTKLFSKLFSLSDYSICEHERFFRHRSMMKFYRDNDFSSFLEDINLHIIPTINYFNKLNKSYGISSGHMFFSIRYLYHIFGENVRFILLVRRPEEFVRSALARGFFDPDHPHSCIQILPNPRDHMFDRWNTASPFEKCLWYWTLVNQFVICAFQKLPKNIYKIFRIEYVNTDLIKDLFDFLELPDFKEAEIQKLLIHRINASPGQGDESDTNPYSLPISLEPIERWNNFQLGLLEQYTGQLRSKLYKGKDLREL